jgi:hypothetical protein
MSDAVSPAYDDFRVPVGRDLFERAAHCWPGLWKRLGNLETWCLGSIIDSRLIDRPIFVAGLARSGSTILLEILAAHPHVATHRYRDFPLVFTPYLWNEIVRRSPGSRDCAVERTHRDGIMITPESPEAMEEPIWQAFFRDAHNPAVSQVLDESVERPDFEKFYCDHIRKLLAIRGGSRYVSKGNYNFSRLSYLQKLFPDARFVLPIRRPAAQIASLMKQQRLFTEGERRHPRALAHMRRVGHFEFGLDCRPINVSDSRGTAEVLQLWKQGEEVRGWARYWKQLYEWLDDCLAENKRLREAALIVRFEDLCSDSTGVLTDLLQHTELYDEQLIATYSRRLHAPTYYRQEFSAAEEEIIAEETADVAERFGYVTTHAADLEVLTKL